MTKKNFAWVTGEVFVFYSTRFRIRGYDMMKEKEVMDNGS